MGPFPFINLFFMFFSAWVALSPKARTGKPRKDWLIFGFNLFAAFINTVVVLAWVFEWITM